MGRCCLPPTVLHLSMLSADSGRLALRRGFPRGASRVGRSGPKTSPALLHASTPALILRSSRRRAASEVLTPDTHWMSASARHLPSVRSCSDFVVSHHRAGLLRARSAGLLHPAAGHGLRCVWRTRSVTLTRHRPCGRCRAARTPPRGMWSVLCTQKRLPSSQRITLRSFPLISSCSASPRRCSLLLLPGPSSASASEPIVVHTEVQGLTAPRPAPECRSTGCMPVEGEHVPAETGDRAGPKTARPKGPCSTQSGHYLPHAGPKAAHHHQTPKRLLRAAHRRSGRRRDVDPNCSLADFSSRTEVRVRALTEVRAPTGRERPRTSPRTRPTANPRARRSPRAVAGAHVPRRCLERVSFRALFH